MSKMVTLKLTPEEARDESAVENRLKQSWARGKSFRYIWRKRSIDARGKNIIINATFELFAVDESVPESELWRSRDVHHAPEVIIIGSGPAGLYAALTAIEKGMKPVIFERGKDVRSRRRDLAALNKDEVVNPESNYCFGEGGAGTYSDGKLYTRSKKRGDVLKVLQWLVQFGASEDILVDAHPHIGTNKLPQLIVAMRNAIIAAGGEVHFNSKLTDIAVKNGKVEGVQINNGAIRPANHVVLATGHSARDVFELLHARGLQIKAKPFALGVRVEHRQAYIDQMQYHGRLSDEYLPPASYQLVTQVEGRGVYSFCMCPGGIIAPCATAPGEVVTNGWSPSKRNNPYANSGIVVSVEPADLPGYSPDDPFICLNFQKEVEQRCHEAAGGEQKVPAQCLKDFVEGRKSTSFPRSSYLPGIVSVELHKVLPPMISTRLRKAFLDFDQKMKGFVTNDAVVHAPESRTSSPVQIPRDPESLSHPQAEGLYPCGEGAGYAGGIVSAAIDGMKVMEMAVQNMIKINKNK